MQPAVDDSLGGGLRILPVAGHHILSAYHDLSRLTGRQGVPLLVAYLDVHGLHGAAGRAEARVTRRIGADHRSGLRQPVSLEYRHADSVEIFLELDVEQGAAADEELEASAEALAYLREHELVDKGDYGLAPPLLPAGLPGIVIFSVVGYRLLETYIIQLLGERAALPDGLLEILLEVLGERGHGKHHVGTDFAYGHGDVLQKGDRALAAGDGGYASAVAHHHIETGDMGETVVKRQYYEHHRAFVDTDDRARLLDIGRVVAVGQQYSLGVGGGAGGVADVGVVVGSHRGDALLKLVRMRGGVFDTCLTDVVKIYFILLERNSVHHDDLLDCGAAVNDPADLLYLALGSHDEARVGMIDAEQQILVGFQLEGKRHVHSSGVEDAELGEDPLVTPFGYHRHLLSFLESERHEAGGENAPLVPGSPKRRLCPDSVLLFPEESLVGVFRRVLLDEVDDGWSLVVHIGYQLVCLFIRRTTGRVRRVRRLSCP